MNTLMEDQTKVFPLHTEEWLQFLETTDLPQAENYLASYGKDEYDGATGPLGYCCLGIACKMMPDGERFLAPGEGKSLPPEAVEWLGLTSHYNGYYGTFEGAARDEQEFDIHLDYDVDLYPWYVGGSHVIVTAAALNDNGLSFKQIVDMIRYFGIKKVSDT